MSPRDAVFKRRDKIAAYLEGREEVTTVPLLKHLRLPNTKKHQAGLRELLPTLGWERAGPRCRTWTRKKSQKIDRRKTSKFVTDEITMLATIRSGGVWTMAQLAEAIKGKPCHALCTVNRLVKKGQVLRIGNQGRGPGTVYISAER